jgi:hypothetical protein
MTTARQWASSILACAVRAASRAADEAQVGDYVIVHVGFAIQSAGREARLTYESLREMSQLDELEWMRESADLALANLQPGASDTTAAAGGNP